MLFLQEADARRIPACWPRSGTGGGGVRMHVDVTDPMFIIQSSRLERDHKLTLARVGRFDVNAEDPWTRRCLHTKLFRWGRAALEANLYVSFSDGFERIQSRQVNGKP